AFDRNLALLFAGSTCLIGKSTTHKTPQSADLFAFRLRYVKGASSSSTWPRYQSPWTLFASRSSDFCRDRVHYQQRTASIIIPFILVLASCANQVPRRQQHHGSPFCDQLKIGRAHV